MGKTVIDILLWVRINTLLVFRKPKVLHLANSCVWPLLSMYSTFKQKESSNIYQINHSSSIAHLEGVLNDRFDSALRRIYITNSLYVQAFYLYRDIEQLPKYVYTSAESNPKYLYKDSELSSSYTFIIHIPNGLPFDITILTALMNKYKLPGTSWIIDIY